jgi:hypothetical protein
MKKKRKVGKEGRWVGRTVGKEGQWVRKDWIEKGRNNSKAKKTKSNSGEGTVFQ